MSPNLEIVEALYILVQISNSLISVTLIINWITPLMHCVVAWNNMQYMMILLHWHLITIWQIPKLNFYKCVFAQRLYPNRQFLLKQKRCSDILNDIWERASIVILYILVTFYLLYCSFDNLNLGYCTFGYVLCTPGNIPLGNFVTLLGTYHFGKCTFGNVTLWQMSLIKMPLEKNFTNKKSIKLSAHLSFNTDNFNEYFQPTICKYFKWLRMI